MWDEAAALDLRRKAEDCLREYKPRGYEPSERATADAVRIREDMRLAYYWHGESAQEGRGRDGDKHPRRLRPLAQ